MAYKPTQESVADGHGELSSGIHHRHQISGKTALLGALAGVAVGGPLLGMMGFAFLASTTLLVVASPLLLLFSPLLLAAAFLLVGVLVGLAASAAMAMAGVSTLAWVLRDARGKRAVGGYYGEGRGKGWGGGALEQEVLLDE